MIPAALLDTDTLSSLMRQDTSVLARAEAYLAEHGQFTISLITRYEILRGLKVKRAAVQLSKFNRFCAVNVVLPITESIIERAADSYADLHGRGLLIGDADILIAATSLEHARTLVSNNTRHFGKIPGLQLLNWLGS